MTWSALSFRGRTICYYVDGAHIEARELGHHDPLTVTEDLRHAIAADVARQAAKAKEP